MKNINELKIVCYKFMDMIQEVHKKLDDNLLKYEKHPRETQFWLFEDIFNDDDEDLDIEFKDDVEEFDEDLFYPQETKELEERYKLYMANKEGLADERLKLCMEIYNINLEFDKWAIKAGLTQSEIDDIIKDYPFKEANWCSNEIIHEVTDKTIELANEKEIEMKINNAKRVMEVFKDMDDFHPELDEYLDNIRFINKNIRHRDNDENYDGCWGIYVMDMLENRHLYVPHCEPFELAVMKIMQEVDDVFLYLCKAGLV